MSLARLLLAACCLLPLSATAADAPTFQLGKEFKALPVPQPTSDPSKIEVIEVFAYSCPHCFAFDPLLKKWVAQQKADVKFVRLPHTLGRDDNALRNKGFYAAQMLGLEDKFHGAMFNGVHEERLELGNPDQLREFFGKKLGVSGKDFDGAFSSFAVDAGVRRGESAIREMAIGSVPTLVIEGRYYTSPSAGGGFPQMLAVADYLVSEARKSKPKASATASKPAEGDAPKKKKKAKAAAAPKTP